MRYDNSVLIDSTEEKIMLHWALVFLVVAIIAGLLGFTGVAGTASSIAWILFVVGLILALVFFLRGRTPL
jgi:uncharacterized membrane protein YtjA (UPF0391 family)